MTERERMLRTVQSHAFSAADVELFLDTHPDCAAALARRRALRGALSSAAAAYAEKYGPLTAAAADGDRPWRWVEGPWPWEDAD